MKFRAIEPLERRQLLAQVAGMLFNDANYNGVREIGEVALSGQTAYVDSNDNGALDSRELTYGTNANGYSFSNLSAGEHVIRTTVPAGYVRTSPVGDAHRVTLGASEYRPGLNFGAAPAPAGGKIFGYSYVDINQ